jgi:hypothetical protein
MLSGAQKLVVDPRLRWAHDPQLWVEMFVTVNLAILAADIFIAHSVNHFQKAAEYIPLYFSLGAPVVLVLGIALRCAWNLPAPWRDVGYMIGWLSVLLVNRMVAIRSMEWARWVILLALGGFFGNFVLSLTDHASNGFFARTEWIPVISSAFASGFLIVPLVLPVTRRFLDVCLLVMGVQAFVGVLGFWFHLQANLVEPGSNLFDKLVNGAPPMAPLLFPNLVGLAFIGLWALIPHVPEAGPRTSWLGATYAWACPQEAAETSN